MPDDTCDHCTRTFPEQKLDAAEWTDPAMKVELANEVGESPVCFCAKVVRTMEFEGDIEYVESDYDPEAGGWHIGQSTNDEFRLFRLRDGRYRLEWRRLDLTWTGHSEGPEDIGWDDSEVSDSYTLLTPPIPLKELLDKFSAPEAFGPILTEEQVGELLAEA